MVEVLTQGLERTERQPPHKALHFAAKRKPEETSKNRLNAELQS